MSVYLSRGAVCEEDARMVCLTGVYVHSPSLISCALHWPCTQQQGVLVALQGHCRLGWVPRLVGIWLEVKECASFLKQKGSCVL